MLKKAKETAGEFKSERVSEIPFDSERKRMTSVNIFEGKHTAFTKGAPEMVLSVCTRALINGKIMSLDDSIKKQIADAHDSMTGKGLRALAFAYKEIEEIKKDEVESDMVFTGLIGLEDPPRPEVPEAISKCRDAGIRIIMITGDGSRTSEAIAREIGLVKENPVIVEGHDFLKMTDKELRDVLSKKEVIFSRMSPKHKMRVVSILKGEGERVAVTGDG